MARKNSFSSGLQIGIVATTLALSPRARRLVRKAAASAVSQAIKAGKIVARGTRNLQEEQKHVVRFGTDASGVSEPPSTEPPAS